jgi:hypothetical protein
MCCDGSKRAAPELRFAHTYASCTDQPSIGLFFALSAAVWFLVMGADCTNAYAHSPSPTQATYVPIDDVTPTGITLAMERNLTARWHYQCSRPCKDTPKPVHCGKSTSTRFSTISILYTSHTSEVSTEVKSTERRPSVPAS